MGDLKLIVKTWSNQIDSSTYKHNFVTNVPQVATRNPEVFRVNRFRTEFGRHTIFNRLMSTFNKFSDGVIISSDRATISIRKLQKNLNNLYVPTFNI